MHAQSASLSSKRDALAARAKELEAKVAKLEREHCGLREELPTLHGIWVDLETKIEPKRELSQSMARAMWKVMEALEGAVADLRVVPPPLKHTVGELDVTLKLLHRVGEVCTDGPHLRLPLREGGLDGGARIPAEG